MRPVRCWNPLPAAATSSWTPVSRPLPADSPEYPETRDEIRRSGPSHCPSVTMSSDPLLLARAATARPREGVTAPPARPRTTTSNPSSKITAQSIAASFGCGTSATFAKSPPCSWRARSPRRGIPIMATCPPAAVMVASRPMRTEAAPSTLTTVPRASPPRGSRSPIGVGTGSIRRVDCAVATIGVGSRSSTGWSMTEGVAGSVPSERAGIDAILRRSCSSFSALLRTADTGVTWSDSSVMTICPPTAHFPSLTIVEQTFDVICLGSNDGRRTCRRRGVPSLSAPPSGRRLGPGPEKSDGFPCRKDEKKDDTQQTRTRICGRDQAA